MSKSGIKDAVLEVRDCLQFLRGLEDSSVDLIVADPPYFIGHSSNGKGSAWDKQWDSEEQYLAWCKDWTFECMRVLKPSKCLYVWGTTKLDTFLRYKLEVLNKAPEAVYQSWIIWHYDWGARSKKNFARKHEDLLMYSKGKTFDFYSESILIPRKVKSNMAIARKINLLKKYFSEGIQSGKDWNSWEAYNFHKKSFNELVEELNFQKEKNTSYAKGKIPTDVWMRNNNTASKEYAGWHPTQKPIEIMDRIIKAHTVEGEVVLDFFSGSGSTMISALKNNRKFIGCDSNGDYVSKSILRAIELVPSCEKNA